MLKYLPYALQLLAVVGGAAGGLWLKSATAPAAEPARARDEAKAAAASHGPVEHKKAEAAPKKADKKAEGKRAGDKKAGGHGGGHGEADADAAYGFMKFSRQFVVPVIGDGGVRALVLMDINIEVPPAVTESVYSQEPKLRDALLASLLQLSNSGAFDEHILERANMELVRNELLRAARSVIGEDAQNVLILNVARQDV
ncbi:hypothetical protein [Amphiplicatus metriothermophilus]|uniref:Flagellar protein FliL n=1 Tax=Amphiplicatus metriothermophilus TaxID=1519374 RepID=A0A239PML4_9PROT|nr:hypothetical protein [Amphiplicatus metriothermophilus]MBB5517320.1 hypothetical protein [Amphiplicatus metriothermophilus]SNT68344.1 hypothetical protein SAMN06297382_0846 [Amphiplicatus metriothermophilus]